MQMYVENLAGKTVLPAESGKHILPLYDESLIVVLSDNESAKIDINGKELSAESAGEHSFRIAWDTDKKCVISIHSDNMSVKYFFQLDGGVAADEEDIHNLLKFALQLEDTFRYGQKYGVTELFDAIKKDQVSLIIERTPYSGYDNQSLLNRITETLPMIMDICSHPKQSLRTEEAVLDVNLVKRVNSKTMDHLASHSEHWKARTLNGLIPNRLRADIFEDEINIYENLFFRMAVDDILKYVHREAVSIEKTIEQNDNAIDWNAYGEDIYDYKRIQIFEQLLPDYNLAQKQDENKTLKSLLACWAKLERNFSIVEASQFYRSIDKKKHISRSIKPTNILKKDSRYNALYRLWCEIQRQIVQEQIDAKEIQGDNEVNIENYYGTYVIILLLYAFKLLGCSINSTSMFNINLDGCADVDATFDTNNITYIVRTRRGPCGNQEVELTFVEKARYKYQIPPEVCPFLHELEEALPEKAKITKDRNHLVFYAKPTDSEQRTLKNVFHINHAAARGMRDDERMQRAAADRAWRLPLETLFSSGEIRLVREKTITIIPQFAFIEKSEAAVDRFTRAMLDSTKDTAFYILPLDINAYRIEIEKENVLLRLLNYGEKYADNEAQKWGNYRTGIIPVAQSEINSAQRLMKLVSLQASKIQACWNDIEIICPICGQNNCKQEGLDNWMCQNPECGIVFGKTRHANGCGNTYEWIWPNVSIKAEKVKASTVLELMLKKELIFDRLAITDFEFETNPDGKVKYIPVCPICGKRLHSK